MKILNNKKGFIGILATPLGIIIILSLIQLALNVLKVKNDNILLKVVGLIIGISIFIMFIFSYGWLGLLYWLIFAIIFFIINLMIIGSVLNNDSSSITNIILNQNKLTEMKFFRFIPSLCTGAQIPSQIENEVRALCNSQGYLDAGNWQCQTDKPENFGTLNYACRIK